MVRERRLIPLGHHEPSVRGGMLEFILKYSQEHMNGLPLGSFLQAIRAEGVPADFDRYTCQAEPEKLLHQTQLFHDQDSGGLGGSYSYLGNAAEPPRLPVSEDLASRLITLPPFTKVPESFVHQVGRAMRKVAEKYTQIHDLRVGV